MANIQIHELGSHSGDLGDSDFFATDNGTNTTKVTAQDILDASAQEVGILMIQTASFSSLPKLIENTAIKADAVVLNSWLSDESVMVGDWEIVPSAGALTITGSISGTTTMTLIIANAVDVITE